jgi:hypothetical protein
MSTTTRTWTAEEIAALFSDAHDKADDATREATKGPFNPYGQPLESLIWHGTIDEAGSEKDWPAADDDGDRPDPTGEATTVVGRGRPIFVAFCDGQYPTVFCEHATEQEVNEAVDSYYLDLNWYDDEADA